jgi:transposase
MPRPHKHPLRTLTPEERTQLEHLARSHTHPAIKVARAKSLLAVANGLKYTEAARSAGRKSGDAVAKLVTHFNTDGLKALQPKHRGGYTLQYTPELRASLLEEARRSPDRDTDGTSSWSITTLQRAVRCKPGLEKTSRNTIWKVLHEAGLTWQRDRTWCETGQSARKRKHGTVIVTDPDSDAKKT